MDKPTDTTTGLDQLGARQYDPATGRFITVDPLVAATGQPYSYAGDNPITNTDPSGLHLEGTGGCANPAGCGSGGGGAGSGTTANGGADGAGPPPTATPSGGSGGGGGAGGGSGSLSQQAIDLYTGITPAFPTRPDGGAHNFIAGLLTSLLNDIQPPGSSALASQLPGCWDPANDINCLLGANPNSFNYRAGTLTTAAAVTVAGSIAGAAASSAAIDGLLETGITNPVPENLEFAKIIKPEQVAQLQAGGNPLLSTYPGATEAFVTSSSALPSGASVSQLARLATIPEENVGGVLRFQLGDINGLASPVNRDIPGFVGGGLTAGGLPEYVIPNQAMTKFPWYSLEEP